MSWFGKILGGGIGFAMGGPLGAVIGAGLGHTFMDSGVGGRARPGAARLSSTETRQAIFFASTFAMLGKMAKADGRVSPEEIQVVNQFIRTRLSVDERARQFAINIFNEAKANNTPFSAYARQFGEQFAQEREIRVMLFELLFELAMADGTMHPAEEALLEEALGPLGLSPEIYDQLRGKKPDVDHLYTLLGVTRDASDAELKSAWRNAVRDFHPDRIVSKGLPDEFTKFAEEKFQEVNDAYETIMEHRGRSSQ